MKVERQKPSGWLIVFYGIGAALVMGILGDIDAHVLVRSGAFLGIALVGAALADRFTR
jgi:hypothetical protein